MSAMTIARSSAADRSARPFRPPAPRAASRQYRAWLPSRSPEDWSDEAPPLETWWALEDLWLRLHRLGHLQLVDRDTIRLPGFRHCDLAEDLRSAVFETRRYGWRLGLERGSFVRTLEYRGDDLACLLTPAAAMVRWPDAATLVIVRAALFVRLERSGARA